MTYLRLPDKASIEEAMTFNYWLIILKLLELGLPWDAIHSMDETEISVVLGIHLATEQRREEQEAAAQRQSAGHMNLTHLKGRR